MEILEELWYGNVTPGERDAPPGSRTHKLGEFILRHEEELLPLLSEQAKEIYEKFRDCQSELHGLTECEAFCSGFTLGTKIMQEVMESMGKYTTEI